MNMFSVTIAESARSAFMLDARGDTQAALNSSCGAVFARSKEHLRVRLYATLFAIDLLCITLAFLVAGLIRLGSPIEQETLRTLAFVIPTFIAVALNNRAYSLESLQRPMTSAGRGVAALFYGIAVAIALLFSLKVSTDFSRAIFAVGTMLAIAAVVAGRHIAGKHFGAKYDWTFANHLMIVDSVAIEPRPGQAVVHADRAGLDLPNDDPKLFQRLSELLQNCDRVIVACPPERRGSWSDALKSSAIDVEILMPELTALGATKLSSHQGETTLLVSSGPLSLHGRILKRALDIVIASLALVLLAPLMLLVALAIRIESRGPVLFRQPRMGQNNRMFTLLKFRSMRVECTDAEGARSASQCDDRLTRMGKFIRQTSLDELPQIFNVIAGSMSIVGPRPHALGSTAEDALFWHIDRRYFDRHAIKPGITGLAQIRGFRGATVRRHDLTNRLHSDLEYVSGWTVWRDLKIIAATFGVLVHANAY
jgi:exopolysaccharide biosynthesis polyprenyl glycosylphosphotransferase